MEEEEEEEDKEVSDPGKEFQQIEKQYKPFEPIQISNF